MFPKFDEAVILIYFVILAKAFLPSRIPSSNTPRSFLSTAYENLEFHKRYNFLSYLIKEINPGGGGNNFDIADKITVSEFRQKQMEEHSGEEIEAKPEGNQNTKN